MSRLTFARSGQVPACVGDWEMLARFAAKLLADREAGLPVKVAEGRLHQEQADAQIRLMRAIAAQWNDAASCKVLPDPMDYLAHYGATPDDMLADLANVMARAVHRATASPNNANAIKAATLATALHWHQQPVAEGAAYPHIWKAADHAHWARNGQRQREAA